MIKKDMNIIELEKKLINIGYLIKLNGKFTSELLISQRIPLFEIQSVEIMQINNDLEKLEKMFSLAKTLEFSNNKNILKMIKKQKEAVTEILKPMNDWPIIWPKNNSKGRKENIVFRFAFQEVYNFMISKKIKNKWTIMREIFIYHIVIDHLTFGKISNLDEETLIKFAKNINHVKYSFLNKDKLRDYLKDKRNVLNLIDKRI